MTKTLYKSNWKKNILKVSFFLLCLCLIVASLYAILFTQQVRCFFVQFSDLQRVDKNLYISRQLDGFQVIWFQENIKEAKNRLQQFFGEVKSNPIIIAGNDSTTIQRFGHPTINTGLMHSTPFGAYIVLGINGLNADVISHEYCHAELLARTNWWVRETQIPTWFDEGLALMLDYRFTGYDADSEMLWILLTKHGKIAPSLDELEKMSDFQYYTNINPLLSYYTSHREVRRWLKIVGIEGLEELCQKLKEGEDFHKVYKEIELEKIAK
ncbi:MAG: hypothetical protein OHK0038_11740 [Flammeovirgaceae bacterium]